MKRICLFLNGTFETSTLRIKINNSYQVPSHLLTKPNYKIIYYAADGGLNHLSKYKFKLTNLSWFGDEDSLNSKGKSFLKKQSSFEKKITSLPMQKNFSDLAAILDYLLLENINEPFFIEIYGGLGGRRDHEVTNIKELKRFLSLHPKGGTAIFYGGVVLSSLPLKLSNSTYSIFSVFANNGLVDIQGARYSGHFTLQRPSHGLSNEITKKVLSLTPIGGIVTVYFEE